MNLDRTPLDGTLDEDAQGAFPDLTRAIDVERPDDRRRQATLMEVRDGQVLLRELADRIRPARFAHGADHGPVSFARLEGVLTEDLARGKTDDAADRRQQ